jgi:hypothetical protein
MATENEFDALCVLIDCMERNPTLTSAALEDLRSKQREIIKRMIETGESWNQASGGPSFLSFGEQDFRAHIRAIDNDLGEQVAIVSQAFANYLETGEAPAPYYPWRIAVILRRVQRPETEKRFLAAWCVHFPTGIGQRYDDLVERYQKPIRSPG